MISKEDLQYAKNDNLKKIAELEAENRVFDKLIAMEESKVVEENKTEFPVVENEVYAVSENVVDGEY